ncbi:P-loop containing nucleoside triphosphate hydrolase protein, partial [Irpex lacteus]
GVGRTTMTLQFALGRVIEEYDPIIHDTFKKRIEFKNDIANVEVTDTGIHISDVEIRAHEGFILIYSITDHLSFDQMRPTFERIKQVKEGESKTFFVILVANKNDLEVHRQVSVEEGKLLAQEFGCQFFQICAKNPVDVEQMFTALVQMMRQRWLVSCAYLYESQMPA